MTKRLFRSLVCVIVALGIILSVVCTIVFAKGEKSAVISIQEIVAESGEEIDVSVSISGNTGIAGVNLSISYDDQVIAPVLNEDTPSYTTDLDGVSSVNDDDGSISYVWASAENFTDDGQIVSFKFKAVDAVYTVTDIVLEDVIAYDADENTVGVATANAKCYIAEFAETGTQTSAEVDGKYAIRFVGKVKTEMKEMLLQNGNAFGFSIKLSGEGVDATSERTFSCDILMHTISGSGYVSDVQAGVDGYEYFALTVYNVPVGYTTAAYSAWIQIDGVTFTNDVGAISVAPTV